MSTTGCISIGIFGGCVALSSLLATAGAVTLSPQSNLPSQSKDPDALVRQALQEGEAGKNEEAIRDYKVILTSRPDWKEGWWNLGTLEYSESHFSDAEATFQKLVSFAPQLGAAWALLGLSEFENGHLDNALVHLENANTQGIKDDPEIERVSLYHLALLRIHSGDFERASDLLLHSFASQSASSQVKFAMGLATLRVPLFPTQISPAREGLVLSTGNAAFAGSTAQAAVESLLSANPDLPYLHLAAALIAAKSGQTTQALQLLHIESTISPQSALSWIEMSRIETQQGHLEVALASAQKAVAIDPRSRATHLALAAAFQAAGHKAQAMHEQELATQYPSISLLSEPRILAMYENLPSDSADQQKSRSQTELWARAMQEYTGAQFTAAIADLQTWLRSSPENGTAWAVLGLCEYALKDHDNALIHLERGAHLGLSGSAESLQLARVTYGTLLVRAGQFDEAIEVLASAHATGSLAARAESASGLALLHCRELPESTTQPAVLISTAGKISLLLEQSKYDEAFSHFQQLLRQYPSVPLLHYAYGTALLALSEFDQATAQMQAEIVISPKSELPLIRLASISLRQHAAAAAAVWAQRALEIAPDSIEGHYLLGRAALESGETETAVRELQQACKLSPDSPEIHFNLAKAYSRAKMPERAEQERNTFAELNARVESQRSQTGSQIYAGPHAAQDITRTPAPPHAQ